MLRTVILIFLLFVPGAAATAELTLTIQNIRSDRGTVRVAIYTDDNSFLQKGREAAARQTDASAGTLVLHFPDLPAHRFAIALHHDENGNGRVDTNLFGIPTEGVGFSNNATSTFGPPDFTEAATTVAGGEKAALEIRLAY